MQLYTDQISGFQSGKAPGVLLIGDVNASGTVDGTDLSSLIDVLESDGYDGSCDPVSYTHLDVYKRQEQWRRHAGPPHWRAALQIHFSAGGPPVS